MSVSSKKRRRHEAWEESLGGAFPVIELDEVDDGLGTLWLYWLYHVAPFVVRVEIPVKVAEPNCPWLWVDGNSEGLDDDATRTRAETQYGVMTRVRLMEAHRDEIRRKATRESGLAKLREAATAAGLYGMRERRRCVIPTWRTHDETAGTLRETLKGGDGNGKDRR